MYVVGIWVCLGMDADIWDMRKWSVGCVPAGKSFCGIGGLGCGVADLDVMSEREGIPGPTMNVMSIWMVPCSHWRPRSRPACTATTRGLGTGRD